MPSIGSVGDPIDKRRARHPRVRGLVNHRRLHGTIGDVPPAELEATYYAQAALGAGFVRADVPDPVLCLRTVLQDGRRASQTTSGYPGHRADHSAFASCATAAAEVSYEGVIDLEPEPKEMLLKSRGTQQGIPK